MCHETTSVALPESIGVPVGTVTLDEFAKTDCILFFGQNVGSNSPRMLHPLEEVSKRGAPSLPITYCASVGWSASPTRSRRSTC
jgi:anaerobic selenocysteine-containing dehydrogenase